MENNKKLTLVIDPDPILHQKTSKVENITPELNEIFDEMADIMLKFQGIGLAGPQVGLSQQIIIIDAETIAIEDGKIAPQERFLKILNPEIIEASKEICTREEGCLSLPTIYYNVDRPESIKVKFQNENGEEIILETDGLLARCLQHEIDHLNGKVFIDYVGPLKKRLAVSKLKKMKIKK